MVLASFGLAFGVLYLIGTIIGLVIGSICFLITEILPLGRQAVEQHLLHRALK
jgi:hypothetical protein